MILKETDNTPRPSVVGWGHPSQEEIFKMVRIGPPVTPLCSGVHERLDSIRNGDLALGK